MGTPTTYLEEVESFFLTLRGRGLMLSPADAERAQELERAGVPCEVVCRGIARAFDAFSHRGPGERPRSLRACDGFIEAEIAEWREKDIGRNRYDAAAEGRSVENALATLLDKIAEVGRASADPARGYHRRAWRGVRAELERVRGGARPDLAALEARLLAELFAELPPAEGIALRRRAELRNPVRRERASERAFAEAAQAALEAELRESYGLLRLNLGER